MVQGQEQAAAARRLVFEFRVGTELLDERLFAAFENESRELVGERELERNTAGGQAGELPRAGFLRVVSQGRQPLERAVAFELVEIVIGESRLLDLVLY